MMLVRLLAVGAAATVLVAAGCRRPVTTPPTVTPAINQDSIARERAREEALARAEAARRDSIARAAAAAEDSARREREALAAAVRDTIAMVIYFDYDSDALRPDARTTLDRKLTLLQAHPGVRLRISGHADERGSDEYNLALGQKRAVAAKRYLVQRGVDESRIEIVSMGEEQPAVAGTSESAWARNRRDEFEITAGGQMSTRSRP